MNDKLVKLIEELKTDNNLDNIAKEVILTRWIGMTIEMGCGKIMDKYQAEEHFERLAILNDALLEVRDAKRNSNI